MLLSIYTYHILYLVCQAKPWRPTSLLRNSVGQVDGLPSEALAADYPPVELRRLNRMACQTKPWRSLAEREANYASIEAPSAKGFSSSTELSPTQS